MPLPKDLDLMRGDETFGCGMCGAKGQARVTKTFLDRQPATVTLFPPEGWATHETTASEGGSIVVCPECHGKLMTDAAPST